MREYIEREDREEVRRTDRRKEELGKWIEERKNKIKEMKKDLEIEKKGY